MSDLEGVSLLALVDCGEDGLVDAEAHGGGNQRQGEVPHNAINTRQSGEVHSVV